MATSDIKIETERLILRLPQWQDFDAYAELFGDEQAARFVGGAMGRPAAWRKFLQQPGAWLVQGFGMFSVTDKHTGEWYGQLGPWKPEGWPGNEVGWAFRRAAWGKGYATEAATPAIDWAFANLGWDNVIHCIDPANIASQALAKRLGSTNTGPGKLPPPLDDHPIEVWGQTRAQWMTRRAQEKAR